MERRSPATEFTSGCRRSLLLGPSIAVRGKLRVEAHVQEDRQKLCLARSVGDRDRVDGVGKVRRVTGGMHRADSLMDANGNW